MSSEEPKRKYLRAYDLVFLKYGFTYCGKNGEHKLLCVLCNKILDHESLKPLKLQRHLKTKHTNYNDKDFDFFFFLELRQKRGGYLNSVTSLTTTLNGRPSHGPSWTTSTPTVCCARQISASGMVVVTMSKSTPGLANTSHTKRRWSLQGPSRVS